MKDIFAVEQKTVIVDGYNFPIEPRDVNVKLSIGFVDFSGVFGDAETGHSAYWVVKLCQRRHAWGPFYLSELEDLYRKAGHTDFRFHNLVDATDKLDSHMIRGWLVHAGNGQYYVTDSFVKKCLEASPAPPRKWR